MKKLMSIACITLLLVSFQNCAKTVSFDPTQGMLESSSFSSDTTLVETELNTPVSFELAHTKSIKGVQLAIAPTGSSSLSGKFTINNVAGFAFTYKPALGFRGKDAATVTVTDSYGNQKSLYVIVNVGNPLSGFEPALAVRGLGCTQCHASVSSNIITDFGYGNDYYFGQKPSLTSWNSGSVYGDHGNNYDKFVIPANKAILVPAARLPANVATATKLTTLFDYVKSEFASSENESTTKATVSEKKSIYIGAPTAADITKAFSLGANERIKYFKNSGASFDLVGLKDKTTFVQNSGTLSCDGDLVVRGPVYFENLKVNTLEGCRIYVIGSVFVSGGITYSNTKDYRNVQITSTKAISLGLGLAKKDGVFCEPTSRYATNNKAYGDSSLIARFATHSTVSGNYLRQTSEPKAFGETIVAEATLIENSVGPMYDASCRPEGRTLSYERLLLNAPIVHSRYEGNFSGTIISEFALMSLGKFVFSFDPVFSKVSVLPFLDSKLILHIEN